MDPLAESTLSEPRIDSPPEDPAGSIRKSLIIFSVVFLCCIIFLILFALELKNTTRPPKTAAVKPLITPTPTPLKGADLSYIMVYTNPDIQVALHDASGKSIGQSHVETIGDPTGESKYRISNNILDYAKPGTGKYTVQFLTTATSNTHYHAQIFLYDKDANVASASTSGVINSKSKEIFRINFNKFHNEDSAIQKE